jgi:hypothetical protein
MIFEMVEQEIFRLAQVNRVVRDVAAFDLLDDLRPNGGVKPLVLIDPLRPDADQHAVASQDTSS